MLFRFSLYGFLKNQRYYEPFLILAFREKGLSFFQIGILIGFREICINLFEVPSGALADLYGRRRAMILSFSVYVVSFLLFGWSQSLITLFGGMFFLALGDAFRTGTHKAMIFDWLRLQGRDHENTKIYGYTRSWSKMGSAISVLIAGGLVFYSGNYSYIFRFSVIPYLLNIINFLGYPAVLDGERKHGFSMKAVAILLGSALKQAVHHSPLRRLMVESIGFGVMFKASKDYLQPVLKQTAILLPLLLTLESEKRTALLVSTVYFVLHLLSSVTSRHAHRLADWQGSEEGAARFIWRVEWLLFACLLPLLWFKQYAGVIVTFVALEALQNFWRPVLVSRINLHSTPEMGATILSIESQAKSFATMLLAPLLGLAVDGVNGFWPVGTVGLLIATGILFYSHTRREIAEPSI
ncbi:MAG: MFS transporter [Candidatus Poribacteria bacterium]|nr:MFS transporter [Candidatus Poribacteria bacterium]